MQDSLEVYYLSCSIREAIGVECPGCGTQRSLMALFRGDLLNCIAFNPSVLLFLLTFLFMLLHLKFNFRNGATILVGMFCVTVLTLILNFVIKLFLFSDV